MLEALFDIKVRVIDIHQALFGDEDEPEAEEEDS